MIEVTKEVEAFIARGQDVVQLAWEIGGGRQGGSVETDQQVILNGLLAMALVEFTAKPAQGRFGYLVHLRDLFRPRESV